MKSREAAVSTPRHLYAASRDERARFASAARPDGLQAAIDQSPRTLAQRRSIEIVFGGAIQRRSDIFEDEEPIQARPSTVNETGMPDHLKAGIESLSSMDMSGVRVHRSSEKPAHLHALAYAQGNDIHLGPGQEQHLPHEVWHLVQQRQGRVRETLQVAGVGVNDDAGLEREADSAGARAAQHRPATTELAQGRQDRPVYGMSPTRQLRVSRPAKESHRYGCGCANCGTAQRVTIPDTHEHADARRFAQERAYAANPTVSGGSGRRAAECEACGKPELMERLEVDHMVPEAFLKNLLAMFHAVNGKQRAQNIASELKLDWSERTELDSSVTNESYSTSMRTRYDNYELEEGLDFKGFLYEVISDTQNLWMLCPECNGKKEKTDKLLKDDYDALNAYHASGNKSRQTMMAQYLSKWIGTNYHWDPSDAEQQIDLPDSPGRDSPTEIDV